MLPLDHALVDVVVGGEFRALGGTGGDGGLKIAVGDAGADSAHELWQISRRAKDAPRVIGACIRGDGRAGASGLGELIEILPAAGTNMKGVRFFLDDGEETELGAEPHERLTGDVGLLSQQAGDRTGACGGKHDRDGEYAGDQSDERAEEGEG